ncbi:MULTISPECIES: TetR/AcrR family transcriptional regulator [Protofrankia]|uniref:TetR family transcriptional regulator n=1 Tax=Protofrankia coriariae TaxID=1562887 RepID=A0ABR5F6R9_9ACTN|nr:MULTISPECIES: TetR/AcrR family transcriptional regulator [Protofrankia]KLL12350.1 TetR family transcriptional regulator [Protofrankia coriariae]ONH37344.1 TetR family transcriptional regulator [Protofrankia sp. BMG5.30]
MAKQRELRVTRQRERGTRAASGPVSAELIEREAIRLFGERTYPVVGMRDISDAVGILPGSLYVHINSKEDLLIKIVERGIRSYLDAIAPIAESEQSATIRLRKAIKAHMLVLATALEQTRVSFHQWTYLSSEHKERVILMRQRYEELFSRILNDGISSGEFRDLSNPRIAVLALIGMLNSATEWYSPTGPLSPEALSEVLADNALIGLQK